MANLRSELARYLPLIMPNKSLGQHWLRDRTVLAHIVDCAEVSDDDTVLEIGPGLGTLTSELLRRAKNVVAVEFDHDLATKLPGQFPGKNLEVMNEDILSFDLSSLPADYKVVANVPYYITSKIIQRLMTANNRPSTAVLLVQKEVAQRLAAQPGDMSLLAISAQVFSQVTLGDVVGKELFTPPPKVDSQVVIFKRRRQSLVTFENETHFFRTVKAGFSNKRKKLGTSLAGGLGIPKPDALELLTRADVSPDCRAQDVTIEQWLAIAHQK